MLTENRFPPSTFDFTHVRYSFGFVVVATECAPGRRAATVLASA